MTAGTARASYGARADVHRRPLARENLFQVMHAASVDDVARPAAIEGSDAMHKPRHSCTYEVGVAERCADDVGHDVVGDVLERGGIAARDGRRGRRTGHGARRRVRHGHGEGFRDLYWGKGRWARRWRHVLACAPK